MQTQNHLILTALINNRLNKRGMGSTLPPLASRLFLLGSIAPDLPLILMTIIFIIADRVNGTSWTPGREGEGLSLVGRLFDNWFFNAWWVKLPHNLFHSPFLVICYALVGYWAWRTGRKWGAPLFWFAVACGFHTTIDILVHVDDGPLIFFPFDWNTRFHSPVSYWDRQHYGREFSIFEQTISLLSLLYLLVDWWRTRRRSR